MKLKEVLAGCSCEPRETMFLEKEISGISYDSRRVERGNVFIAIRGEHYDGHDFIPDAMKRGASAIIHEKEDTGNGLKKKEIPTFIRVKESRDALACIAGNFYRAPSQEVLVIGVTGTNGKTTTTYLIKSILQSWGKESGLIGTVRYLIKDREYPAFHTTPEAPEFQGLLREMVSSGCTHIVAEVSSHALSQKRVDYTRFSTAAFTNLTRDHLDFHGTMENYFSAKKRLFTELLTRGGTGVINVDDEWGGRLFYELQGTRHLVTYGLNSRADINAVDIVNSFSGVSFLLKMRGKGVEEMHSSLVGIANVYNVLAAVAVSLSVGTPIEVAAEGVRSVMPVPGRLEKVEAGQNQNFLCLVDYAHTPDALERLIEMMRSISRDWGHNGKIITVFGCGGNRDRGKRPLMGEIATRESDHVILTSDNPRMEDPSEIIKEIVLGVVSDNYITVPDRSEAIQKAVKMANRGDVVIIAGKGHEDYQEVKGVRYPFSDRALAREAIRDSARADK